MSRTTSQSRRGFLKKGALAAAGMVAAPMIIPSSALGADGHTAPSNRITMGCIGMGWMGGANLGSFLGHSNCRVVAVCDVDRNHLEGSQRQVNAHYKDEGCAAYHDFRELLAREDIDTVSLGLPDHWHAIPAVMAARAGKDIYGEKPLALTIPEGRAICDAVKRYGRIWQTGSWQRSNDNFRRGCELVLNGRIGEVRTVEVGLPGGHADFAGTKGQEAPQAPPPELDYDFWLGPAPWEPYCPARVHKNFRWVSDYSGGQITDWAGHHIDIANWGMGTSGTGPISVEGEGRFPRTGLWNTCTEYTFVCEYAEGFTLNVSSRNRGGTRFIGSEGWVHVNRGEISTSSDAILRSEIKPNEINLYRSTNHWGNFLDCVRSRRETITPAESAQRAITVGHLGIIAMTLGRRIEWDPVHERIVNDPEAERLLSRPMRSPWHL